MATSFYFKTASDQPDFTVEVAIRDFEPARPYPQNPQAIVYRTRFMQLRAYYTRPTANTPHPSLPQVYFADDIDFQDRPGGVMEWTRVYVTIPAQWSDYESDSYNYPGYLYRATPTQRGRNPFTHIVTTKVTKDYYLVGNQATFTANISDYDNPAVWSAASVTPIANYAAVPVCAGGGNYATIMSADASLSAHFLSRSSSTQPNGLNTGSVFVKKVASAPTDKMRLAVYGPGGTASGAIVDFNLSTGQVQGVPVGNGYGIQAIGEGWWRVNATVNSNGTVSMAVYVLNNSGNVNYSPPGTGQAEALYVWRGQIVNGNTAPHATVAPTVAGDGTTNYPITTADQIPQTFGTQYLYEPNIAQGSNISVEYLSNGSSPNYNTYAQYVTTDQGNSNSYSIESQDSTQSLWYGSVWERNRKFVKAR